MSVCGYMGVCAHACRCFGSEEGVKPPGAGVAEEGGSEFGLWFGS